MVGIILAYTAVIQPNASGVAIARIIRANTAYYLVVGTTANNTGHIGLVD